MRDPFIFRRLVVLSLIFLFLLGGNVGTIAGQSSSSDQGSQKPKSSDPFRKDPKDGKKAERRQNPFLELLDEKVELPKRRYRSTRNTPSKAASSSAVNPFEGGVENPFAGGVEDPFAGGEEDPFAGGDFENPFAGGNSMQGGMMGGAFPGQKDAMETVNKSIAKGIASIFKKK